MENIQRNLEKEVARLSLPKPSKRVKHWTLLLIGDKGEIISVRWLKSLAMGSALALVVAVAAIVCLGFFYKSAIKENKNLQKILVVSQQQVGSLQDEKDILMARLVIAESKVKATPAETQEKQPIKKDAAKTKPEVADVKKNAVLAEKQPEKKSAPEVPAASVPAEKPQIVAVENFITSFNPDIKILKVQFKIVNTSPDSRPVSGHAFVILKPDDVKQEKWTILPSVALISGKPSLIKRGQAFLIARFRNVEFKARGQTDPNRFKKASVVIYSTEGELLLEKDFPILGSVFLNLQETNREE